MPRKATKVSGYQVTSLMSCLLLVIFAACLPVYGSEQTHGTKPAVENPHNREGSCHVCHVASESDLNSWFTFSSTKKKLKQDFNRTCTQCHPVYVGHGLGKVPFRDHKRLPFDAEGKITCAITCHDMHISNGDGEQLRYHLRWPLNTLCESCHLN